MSVYEQYNYGWFVPFFTLFLFLAALGGQAGAGNQRSKEDRMPEVRARNFGFSVAAAICCLCITAAASF